ncbi:MAG: hypothetical protein COR54_14335, partial [Elusimicrobia bacterium CG22_combo_CG10-13_8_21_14_all_63_91]
MLEQRPTGDFFEREFFPVGRREVAGAVEFGGHFPAELRLDLIEPAPDPVVGGQHRGKRGERGLLQLGARPLRKFDRFEFRDDHLVSRGNGGGNPQGLEKIEIGDARARRARHRGDDRFPHRALVQLRLRDAREKRRGFLHALENQRPGRLHAPGGFVRGNLLVLGVEQSVRGVPRFVEIPVDALQIPPQEGVLFLLRAEDREPGHRFADRLDAQREQLLKRRRVLASAHQHGHVGEMLDADAAFAQRVDGFLVIVGFAVRFSGALEDRLDDFLRVHARLAQQQD